MMTLLGLFAAAFLAATLLPAQSEILLATLLWQGDHGVAALLLVATFGNVLGSLVNWIIGRGLGHLADGHGNPRLARARDWYGRYGWWSLFGSWLPVIGDPLTVVAGLMREPLWRFLLVVTIAKAGRYAVLAAATLAWMEARAG